MQSPQNKEAPLGAALVLEQTNLTGYNSDLLNLVLNDLWYSDTQYAILEASLCLIGVYAHWHDD